jgi:hypothetical protein
MMTNAMPKQRINLLVEEEVWLNFRALCVMQKTSASQEVEALMRERLVQAEQQKADEQLRTRG